MASDHGCHEWGQYGTRCDLDTVFLRGEIGSGVFCVPRVGLFGWAVYNVRIEKVSNCMNIQSIILKKWKYAEGR